MPKTRHQEPRTSLAERLMDRLMPCFSSMSAGEASANRTDSQIATAAAGDAAEHEQRDRRTAGAGERGQDPGYAGHDDDPPAMSGSNSVSPNSRSSLRAGVAPGLSRRSPACRSRRGW